MNRRKEKGMIKRGLKKQETSDNLLKSSEEFHTKNIRKKSVLTIIKKLLFSYGRGVLYAILIIYGILCIAGLPHVVTDSFTVLVKNLASESNSSVWSDYMILYNKRMLIFILALIALILPSIYRCIKNYLERKSKSEIIKDILKSLDILQAFYLISIAASLLLTWGIVCCLIYIENIEIIRKITVSSAGSDIIKFLFYLMIPVFVIEVVIRIIQVFAKNEKLESRCLKNMIHEWNKADDVSLGDRERNKENEQL